MQPMKRKHTDISFPMGLALLVFVGILSSSTVCAGQPATAAYSVRNLPPVQNLLLQQLYGKALPANLLDNLSWKKGDPVTFASMRGKVAVLQLWRTGGTSDQSWWAIANASQKKFGAKNLTVIAIHTNKNLAQASAYIDQRPFTVTTAIDTTGELTRFFHGQDKPINILIDRQGAVYAGGLTGHGLNVMIRRLVDIPFDADAPAPTMFIDPDIQALAKQLKSREPAQTNPEKVATTNPAGFPPFKNPISSALDFRGKQAPAMGNLTWLTDAPKMKGKVLIVDFWATWCGPCVASIPKMNEHADRFAQDVVVVGLSNEKEDVVRKFLKKKEMRYNVAVDIRAQMQRALQIRGIPHVVVMSPDGVIRFQGHPAYLTDAIISQIVDASKSLNN